MSTFDQILSKLQRFTNKYYINELIKGLLLFLTIGLLYLLITLTVENFLWLDTKGRSLLFWSFLLVCVFLLVRFVLIPIFRLFRLSKGINNEEASLLIGKHFPDVNDKLLNLLQLKETHTDSELLLASIEQKSNELNPIPFNLAIDFKKNFKYVKYLLIPLSIVAIVLISGKISSFFDSYKRVVNYTTVYEPPAPFHFQLLNTDLNALQNQDYKVIATTEGEITPEFVTINYNDQSYFLTKNDDSTFEYTFDDLQEPLSFHLKSNDVTSVSYDINITKVPKIHKFAMYLNYPNYTSKKDEKLVGTGNAIVPQGTVVSWKVETSHTDDIKLVYDSTSVRFTQNDKESYTLSKSIKSKFNYDLITSNKHISDYERLRFKIDVVNDEYPEMTIKSEQDSLNLDKLYFYGQIADDYGFSKLQMVYNVSGSSQKMYEILNTKSSNFDQFLQEFPGSLNIQEGIPYEIYFEVYDNDKVNNYKKTKSQVFNFRKRTEQEKEDLQLEEQKETIKDLDKSLEKLKKNEKELDKLSKFQKEKKNLNFNDQKKFSNFLKRQQKQESMMKNFNQKLQKNLEELKKDEQDVMNDLLKERLERQEKELEKNERLLEELKKMSDKISQEELAKKLDEVAKNQKNEKRNLEQILELTKRYYVEQKAEKLTEKIEELAKKQSELAKKDPSENTSKEQEKLNEAFDKLQEEMKELEEENKELKDPFDLNQDPSTQEEIKEEQQKAKEDLEQGEQQEDQDSKSQSQQNAQQHQKNAAKKMKSMGMKMASSMSMSGQETLDEDMEMLRQILDNLVIYSFQQEAVMESFGNANDNNSVQFSSSLKRQHELRELFEHVDDSLFALSLRQPKVAEQVNYEINEVYYNVDKSLERLVDNKVYQGISNQQYAITAANNLADFLADMFNQMQMQMSGSGSGKGKPKPGQGQGQGQGQGFQLPDIIQSQEQLNKMMKEGIEKSKDGQGKDGESGDKKGEGKDGKESGGKEGKKGSEGEGKGKEGKSSKGEGEGSKGEGGKGDGNGSGGEGGSSDEESFGELYKIYQQQQQLRQQLQDKLSEDGLSPKEKNLLNQMEQVEDQLLDKQFDETTLTKMLNLQHQLLKLKEANYEQGEKEERESTTNNKEFNNTSNAIIPDAKQYFNAIEILNRQVLPLQQIYKNKVQQYFKKEAN